MRHALNPFDRGFFLLESDEAPCHVGLLALFTPPADGGPDFVRDLVARMHDQHEVAPPFNYKLEHHRPPLLLGPWLELPADEVDLDYHFRQSALPRPGSQRDLGILISRLHSRPLDPSRPMWEQHIIEGLDDDRFALYFKVHHALMDGITGTRKFTQSLSQDIDDAAVRPMWIDNRRDRAPGADGGGSLRARAIRAAKDVGGTAKSLLGVATKPGALLGPDIAVPFLGPLSPTLNGRVSRQRRIVTQTYEMSRLRAVATATGASLNDVFLAVCSAALRRYLQEIGEPQVRSLVAGVPVSLREAGDDNAGNAVGMLAAKLHTDLDDPLERLRAIIRSTTAAKEGLRRIPPAARSLQSALTAGPWMAQVLIGVAGRGGRPHANLVLSNVPGPSAQQYLGGAKLDEAYPLSMLMHGQTLNITAFSTGGRLNIGVLGCRDQLPHLQRMATYLADALEELEAAT